MWIRGRLYRNGIKRLTFEQLLDVIWSEIYDDCPPLGDRQRYRDIIHKLYIEGVPANQITWTDSKGKVHRLSSVQSLDKAKGTAAFEQAREMAARMKELQQAARQAAQGKTPDVASSTDE